MTRDEFRDQAALIAFRIAMQDAVANYSDLSEREILVKGAFDLADMLTEERQARLNKEAPT